MIGFNQVEDYFANDLFVLLCGFAVRMVFLLLLSWYVSAHAPPPRPVFFTPRRFAVGFLFWKSGFTVPFGVLKKTMRWLVLINAMIDLKHRIVSNYLSHCFFVFLRMRFLYVVFTAFTWCLWQKTKAPASLVWAREAGAFICYVSSVSGDYNL